MAAALKIAIPHVLSFSVETPAGPLAKTTRAVAKSAATAPSAFHVILGGESAAPGLAAKTRGRTTARGALTTAAKVRPFIAVVAREVGGQIVSYRELHRR